MTTFIDDRRVIDAVASPARYFYFSMALACAAVAFLGFAPTFFLPLASGKFSAPPSIMIHGIVFFAWSLFFVYQAWLPAAGQTGRHRTVGIIGVSLATTMTIFGLIAGVTSMQRAVAIGPEGRRHRVLHRAAGAASCSLPSCLRSASPWCAVRKCTSG